MSEAQLKKPLYTTGAVAIGGRNGHSQNKDGSVSFDLSIPKSMGGPGKPNTTTPEDLFAVGYAACFGSACEYVAKNIMKVNAESIKITSDVTIGEDVAGGFALEVRLHAQIKGLDAATVDKLLKTAHTVCPYSKAISGNVKVVLEVEG